MSVELRKAGPDDAAVIASIHLRARAAAGDAFPPAVHEEHELIPHLLRDVLPQEEVWLAMTDRRAIGYLALDGGLISGLYVDPEAQRSGVGAHLLAHAKGRRPDELILWVFTSNVPARAFYGRHGFEVIGGTDGDNEEGAPDLLMRWSHSRGR